MVTFTRMSDGQPLPASKINELQQELEILSNGTASLNGFFPMTAGKYYNPYTHGLGRAGAIGVIALAQNQIRLSPIYIPAPMSFDRIGVNVTTAVAAATLRLGIFTRNMANDEATTILDAGDVSAAATGAVETTINQQLDRGWYWLGVNASAAGIAIAGASGDHGIEFVPSANAQISTYLGLSITYGAPPATFSTTGSTVTVIGTYLRAA